jgi:putative ABC transport system permease protein
MAFRASLLLEVLHLALDTLRANKLRSALTILGVVIGVTSIVAMTSLVRGFAESLYDAVRRFGADTVYVVKFPFGRGGDSKAWLQILKRPDITEDDARIVANSVPSAQTVSVEIMGGRRERLFYASQSTPSMRIRGVSAEWADTNFVKIDQGRFFSPTDVDHRRFVCVLGADPVNTLFPNLDPIGKKIRIGSTEFTVVGVLGKLPSAFGPQDNVAYIPNTTYEKRYGFWQWQRGVRMHNILLGVVPRKGVERTQLIDELTEVMRIRHHLKLDQPNDFEIVTQDVMMSFLDTMTRSVFLALVVISSIALMVGGIGVMAIMTISVTERTREIGVRKALGARRREILWQFLIEAAFLTSIGGILGILIGSGIALAVNMFAGWAVSMPWWSFALGLTFSATVGILFGMLPAVKAARLDPIEALRYE